MRKILIPLALVAAASIIISAQVKPGATATDVALYTGADRMEKLIAGAKKEGALNIYTSAQSTDLGAVVAAFEKKYGIKASVWRAGSENVLHRAVQESRAGGHVVERLRRRIDERREGGAHLVVRRRATGVELPPARRLVV